MAKGSAPTPPKKAFGSKTEFAKPAKTNPPVGGKKGKK